MLSLCAVTATDGIFVGQGVGSDGLAAVNICISPTMIIMGISLMLGVGASVVSSIHLANKNIKAARLNTTQALGTSTMIVLAFLTASLISPATTGRMLGSSDSLMPLVKEYMPWIFGCTLFQSWCAIGLFIVRLDGSPKYAMWCNIIPGILNALLDYIFIFPLGMGLRGAGIATFISCALGGVMVISFLGWHAETIRLIKVKMSKKSLALTWRNIVCQCKIGVSALMGEATMGIMMLLGNIMFMKYSGDNGVGAFSIACYYLPFVFMIGNAIAQSAQPIISYNFGLMEKGRVVHTERLAIISAVGCGLIITLFFVFLPSEMVNLFLRGESTSIGIATHGFPLFSASFIFFIFNLTAIGYFQSVEKVIQSIIFALLRGAVFLIPAFIIMPLIMGISGIWLALGVSECLTSISIICYYLIHHHSTRKLYISK